MTVKPGSWKTGAMVPGVEKIDGWAGNVEKPGSCAMGLDAGVTRITAPPEAIGKVSMLDVGVWIVNAERPADNSAGGVAAAYLDRDPITRLKEVSCPGERT